MSKFAMAHAMKKRHKKMYAEGGDVKSGKDRDENEKGVHKSSHQYGSTDASHAGAAVRSGAYSKTMAKPHAEKMQSGIHKEHNRVLNENRSIHPKLQGLAEGGEVDLEDAEMSNPEDAKAMYEAEIPYYKAKNEEAKKNEPKESVAKMAHGGMMEGYQSECDEHCGSPCEVHQASDDDMIGRVLKKHYSKGGMVANEDHVDADFEENEFDDLAKDDHLESKQHDYGDEDGNEYGADHDDMVAKVMMKRKKQSNPRPA